MAFAAILSTGSVVAWGDPDWGGDCTAVQDQLQYLYIDISAFAGRFPF
jgi:hypothetical protein